MQLSWARYDILASYFLALAIVAGALGETFRPFRQFAGSTVRKWLANGILFAVTNVVLLIVFRFSGVALAAAVQSGGHALFGKSAVPFAVRFVGAFLLLDFLNYAGHRLNHSIPFLWRLHRVHHTETDLDVTTGVRFHPLEAIVTHGLPLAAIALLGLPVSAVLAANLSLIAQDVFTHANLGLPGWAERALGRVIITPGLHRLHHSRRASYQNTNFGTVLSGWDRALGTFRRAGTDELCPCGLADVPDGSSLNAAGLLALPFKRPLRSAAALERPCTVGSGVDFVNGSAAGGDYVVETFGPVNTGNGAGNSDGAERLGIAREDLDSRR